MNTATKLLSTLCGKAIAWSQSFRTKQEATIIAKKRTKNKQARKARRIPK